MVPAVIFNDSSDDENSMSFDSRRITSAEWVAWSKIAMELCR
jgi:hypothetical protein